MATLHAGLRCFLERGASGTLCGVSSLAGTGGFPSSGSYAASKAALSTWLETLQADLAGSGVSVVDVRPGYVHTEMTADAGHALPFAWPVERAVTRILAGLDRGTPRVVLPWQLRLILGALACAVSYRLGRLHGRNEGEDRILREWRKHDPAWQKLSD